MRQGRVGQDNRDEGNTVSRVLRTPTTNLDCTILLSRAAGAAAAEPIELAEWDSDLQYYSVESGGTVTARSG